MCLNLASQVDIDAIPDICIAFALSNETFKRQFDTLVMERSRAEAQTEARRLVQCFESARTACESRLASVFDDCVAERSMRLCGQRPPVAVDPWSAGPPQP